MASSNIALRRLRDRASSAAYAGGLAPEPGSAPGVLPEARSGVISPEGTRRAPSPRAPPAAGVPGTAGDPPGPARAAGPAPSFFKRRKKPPPRPSASAALRSATPLSAPGTPRNDAAPKTNLAMTPAMRSDEAAARQSVAGTDEALVKEGSSSMALTPRPRRLRAFGKSPRLRASAPAALTSTTSEGSEYPLLPCAPHATTRYCRRRAGCPSGFQTLRTFLFFSREPARLSFSRLAFSSAVSATRETCASSSASSTASTCHLGSSPARRCSTYACTGGVPSSAGARHCTATAVAFTATARTFVGAPGGAPSPRIWRLSARRIFPWCSPDLTPSSSLSTAPWSATSTGKSSAVTALSLNASEYCGRLSPNRTHRATRLGVSSWLVARVMCVMSSSSLIVEPWSPPSISAVVDAAAAAISDASSKSLPPTELPTYALSSSVSICPSPSTSSRRKNALMEKRCLSLVWISPTRGGSASPRGGSGVLFPAALATSSAASTHAVSAPRTARARDPRMAALGRWARRNTQKTSERAARNRVPNACSTNVRRLLSATQTDTRAGVASGPRQGECHGERSRDHFLGAAGVVARAARPCWRRPTGQLS